MGVTARYLARQAMAISVAALIPAIWVGALKLGVEMLYGHSFWVSLGPAELFFFMVYGIVAVGGWIASSYILSRNCRRAGITLTRFVTLPRSEQDQLEKQWLRPKVTSDPKRWEKRSN